MRLSSEQHTTCTRDASRKARHLSFDRSDPPPGSQSRAAAADADADGAWIWWILNPYGLVDVDFSIVDPSHCVPTTTIKANRGGEVQASKAALRLALIEDYKAIMSQPGKRRRARVLRVPVPSSCATDRTAPSSLFLQHPHQRRAPMRCSGAPCPCACPPPSRASGIYIYTTHPSETAACMRAPIPTQHSSPHHRHRQRPRPPTYSEMRQVPDNQEAFVDQASEASLILELLELERDRPGPEVGKGKKGGVWEWVGGWVDGRLAHSSMPNFPMHIHARRRRGISFRIWPRATRRRRPPSCTRRVLCVYACVCLEGVGMRGRLDRLSDEWMDD